MRHFFRRWLPPIPLLFFATSLLSQSSTSGDGAGAVFDPSGAVVSHASLVLKNTDSGESRTSATNEQGAYRFALLKPGHYDLTVTAPGLAQVEKIEVQVGQQTTLSIQLLRAILEYNGRGGRTKRVAVPDRSCRHFHRFRRKTGAVRAQSRAMT